MNGDGSWWFTKIHDDPVTILELSWGHAGTMCKEPKNIHHHQDTTKKSINISLSTQIFRKILVYTDVSAVSINFVSTKNRAVARFLVDTELIETVEKSVYTNMFLKICVDREMLIDLLVAVYIFRFLSLWSGDTS